MPRIARISSLLVALALLSPGFALAGPAESTRKLIETFKATGPKQAAALDKLFDFDGFTAAAVDSVKDKLSPEQLKSVRADIVGIVRARAYPRGGELFVEGKVTEGAVGKQGALQTFDISIYFAKQDLTMDLQFAFDAKGRVVDVSFDDDSLTKDFRVQLARFLSKKTPAELVAKLSDKRKEAEKAAK